MYCFILHNYASFTRDSVEILYFDRDSVAFPHVYQNLFAPIVRSSSA